MHAAIALLSCAIACVCTAAGYWVILSPPANVRLPYRGRSFLLHLLQGLMLLASFIVLIALLPGALVLWAASRTGETLAWVTCGIWFYAFGALPWVVRGLRHPDFVSLPGAERKRARPAMILLGLVLPLFFLGGMLSPIIVMLVLPIPAWQSRLNQTPLENPGLIVPLAIVLLIACPIAGFVGYRAWRFLARRFLALPMVDAITRGRGVRDALEQAASVRQG
ncbi:MAG TPA: hypothetical protein VII72_13580 [Myxococcota bacterium]|jgi:hypothetical protein